MPADLIAAPRHAHARGAAIASICSGVFVLAAAGLLDSGQRQFVPAPVPKQRGGRIGPLLDQVRARLDERWPVDRMAHAAGVSQRILARRMKAATGLTPLGWLTSVRVARAAELLETNETPLADVAAVCGFGSPETFRREFRRARGVSPSQHRAASGAPGTGNM